MPFDVNRLDDYEQVALAEIRAWSTSGPSLTDRALRRATKPIDRTFDLALSSDWARARFESAMEGLVSQLDHWVRRSVPKDPVLERYEKLGVTLERYEDVAGVHLAEADRAASHIRRTYMSALTVEGAAAGASSVAGPGVALAALVADVPAVLGLLLRSVNDTSRYYGFDPDQPAEKHFAVQTVALATEITDTGRTAGLFAVYRVTQDLARQAAWSELEKHALVRAIQTAGEKLGIRLTQRKLGQVVPVVGAALGAGFNGYIGGRVLDAARHLNRARFLARRYDVSMQEVVGTPSKRERKKAPRLPEATGENPA